MIGQYYKSADFKTEKHAPVIKVQENIGIDEPVAIELIVGEDIPHPNTVEHHIAWMKLYFIPEGSPIAQQVGEIEFTAHGDAPVANEGAVHALSRGVIYATFKKSGKLIATSYCNFHGLWESEKEIVVK